MKTLLFIYLFLITCMVSAQDAGHPLSWTADNGNGTYTNPLFYDEFSDPDLIRVGDDFYLAGTTMHSMPGLVVLHSKDLVNWKFMSYCFDRLNLGDDFRLENGKEAYGQGIWAPCIRYHEGKFYIFSNINGHGMQVFIADNPAGPWKHIQMGGNIHDLSVLFDDDGKIYAVYNYDEVRMIEIKPDFSGYVEGSERVIIPAGNAMGEGHHFYKINGKYYILSANYAPVGRMQCARADRPEGPYETVTISAKETLGTQRVHSVTNVGAGKSVLEDGFKFNISSPEGNGLGVVPLHQGGIVDLPNGEWWGFSMMDFRAVGRTTCLSPVTWVDGWPYFGLPGNLGRSPRTWIKPEVGMDVKPHAPYQRSDDFNGKELLPVWQWNHEPVEKKWSLTKGKLRLHTMPARNFLWAKNTLTQRGIGPVSIATVELDGTHLKDGDVAGLGLLNIPYSWLGVLREGKKLVLRFRNQATMETIDVETKTERYKDGIKLSGAENPLASGKVYLRVTGRFDEDLAQFSYSFDGHSFTDIGGQVVLPYQLKTFQGTRYALFASNAKDREGGYAEFDNFRVDEPYADRSAHLPVGKVITLVNIGSGNPAWANPHGMLHSTWRGSEESEGKGCQFRVHDRGQGRVVLEALNGTGFVTVVGAGLSSDVRLMKNESAGSLFQWQDMLGGQCMLLSLKTNRYIGIGPDTGEPYSADWPGVTPNRKDGTVFEWKIVNP
ncbi:glycoside hydrolase family 43 protein [Phocaeicola sp.]